MKELSEKERALLREKVLGLGERSLRKTYFPESQERLRELQRFRSLLDHSNDVFLIVELPSLRLVDLNKSACLILGFSQEQCSSLSLKDLLLPSGFKKVSKFLLQAKPGDQRKLETKLKSKKSGEIPIEMTLLVDSFEREIYCLVVARDITDRKRLEEEKARIEALKETDRLKDDFLNAITHELRTPLNAITGFGSVLDDEVTGPLTPRQHEILSKILKSSDRMLLLINDLLDFAKIKAGKFKISPFPCDYPSLVEEAVKLMEFLAKAKDLAIECDVQVNVPLSLDGERIVQVLINLLSNSIKFTPPNGKIRIRAGIEGENLFTEVNDSGIGIAEKDIPLLFTPFHQLDRGLTRKAGGTGLGLSISKGIVEAHGGEISVSSPGLGKGSTFRFTIPAKRGNRE